MAKSGSKKDLAGGLSILAAAVYLCVKGLKKVDRRLRQNKK